METQHTHHFKKCYVLVSVLLNFFLWFLDTYENAPVEEYLPENLVHQREEEVNMGEVYNPPDANEDVEELTDTLLDTNLCSTPTVIHDAAPKKSYASIVSNIEKDDFIKFK